MDKYELLLKTPEEEELYTYFLKLEVPFRFQTSFEMWKNSVFCDVDGEGRTYFHQLKTLAAYADGAVVGFVQYGFSDFGFAENGEITRDVNYPVIRTLYYDEAYEDAGEMLLQSALQELGNQRVYAFFHYFGMSCCARHGKLPEIYGYIERLLEKNGFEIEHENVYYSKRNLESSVKQIEILPKEETMGAQQALEFRYEGEYLGECELHYVNNEEAYLRWIYISDSQQNCGLGTKAMSALCSWLLEKGYHRLDTDTALSNVVAQHFYEKNGFERCGVTRSFIRYE